MATDALQELYWRTFGVSLAAYGAMWRGPPPPAWAAAPPHAGATSTCLNSTSHPKGTYLVCRCLYFALMH